MTYIYTSRLDEFRVWGYGTRGEAPDVGIGHLGLDDRLVDKGRQDINLLV